MANPIPSQMSGGSPMRFRGAIQVARERTRMMHRELVLLAGEGNLMRPRELIQATRARIN